MRKMFWSVIASVLALAAVSSAQAEQAKGRWYKLPAGSTEVELMYSAACTDAQESVAYLALVFKTRDVKGSAACFNSCRLFPRGKFHVVGFTVYDERNETFPNGYEIRKMVDGARKIWYRTGAGKHDLYAYQSLLRQ